ncbi:MAG: DUF885 family protein [bacterium]
MKLPSSSLEIISRSIFETLARKFPISCASDEFFYFPQIRLPDIQWSVWDSYSQGAITELITRLSIWSNELDQLTSHEMNRESAIDIALIKKLIVTLREHLSEVKVWEHQPSLYLTLSCIGLAEAMDLNDREIQHERIRGLPAFLDEAQCNLNHVPVLFRDIGREMISDTRNYFLFLQRRIPELKASLRALDRFEKTLQCLSTRDDFLLAPELIERIMSFHINCDMEIQEIDGILDEEINDMKQILYKEAKNILMNEAPVLNKELIWEEALQHIHQPDIKKEGVVGLYRQEVDQLKQHCITHGFITTQLAASCPVKVSLMPSYFTAIRASSSYSIMPHYPPTGGIFYISSTQEAHREYKMLASHETYPGHHLLDSTRWNNARSCRRVIEQPLFYEGWACFAEELMRLTGYFSDSTDRLLLAKRRLWRAIRGKVDVGLQTGRMDMPTAATYLHKSGISRERAMSTARKYSLNPGYQLCYSIGLHKFLKLYERYGKNNLHYFIHTILNQGEINFLDLEMLLAYKG